MAEQLGLELEAEMEPEDSACAEASLLVAKDQHILPRSMVLFPLDQT